MYAKLLQFLDGFSHAFLVFVGVTACDEGERGKAEGGLVASSDAGWASSSALERRRSEYGRRPSSCIANLPTVI